MSRFDGQAFANYGVSEGLPHPNVNHLLEARDGTYWIATNGGGVARFTRAASQEPWKQSSRKAKGQHETPLFTIYPVDNYPATNRVNILYEDRSGRIWAGTDGGLFRLEKQEGQEAFEKVDLGLAPNHRWVVVLSCAEDAQGRLWIGTSDGVFVRDQEGRTRQFTIRPALGYDWVRTLLLDAEGRLWIGHLGAGLILLNPALISAFDDVSRDTPSTIESVGSALLAWFTKANGLPGDAVYSLHRSSLGEGYLWAGTAAGVGQFDGRDWQVYGRDEGIIQTPLSWLSEDLSGNLWAATSQGAVKIILHGITTFRQEEGLNGSGIRAIFETSAGNLCVVSNDAALHYYDGQRFQAARPRLDRQSAMEWPQTVLEDQKGEWWIATSEGLFRFQPPEKFSDWERQTPLSHFTRDDGLPGNWVLGPFESSSGDIWFGISQTKETLVRWERASATFRYFSEEEGAPPFLQPSCFAEDRAGNIWIGLYDGGLLRHRDGNFRHFTQADGVPPGQILDLYVDQTDRLWVATNASGVACINDTSAEKLEIASYSVTDGLTSNHVACLAEDDRGRIYLGTGHGVDRIDPATGQIMYYAYADGLDIGTVEVAFRDRQGNLWFGGRQGLARLVPAPDRPRQPPHVFITGLRISGIPVAIAEQGETQLAGLELGPDERQIAIEYVGPGAVSGRAVRYQIKLDGSGQDWSAPAAERFVNYANLAPGKYRFFVRAVDDDGTVSEVPASLAFTVLPPFWKTWWFLLLLTLAIVAAVYAAHRRKVTHLLAMERVRTNIAADLHDDIGANLTRIAILSEVAQQQPGGSRPETEGPLASIARISRDSVSAMSDIVWAIDPRHDSLLDLVRRMLRHAEELFTVRGIRLDFLGPDREKGLKIDIEVRRDLFLFFKEAVNNAARHSQCSHVRIHFRVVGTDLLLDVADNGRGFDPAAESEGQGLASMRRRAQNLGGNLTIESAPGRGTTVSLEIRANTIRPGKTGAPAGRRQRNPR